MLADYCVQRRGRGTMAAVGRWRPPWLGCVFERNIYLGLGTLQNQRTLRTLSVFRCLTSDNHCLVLWVPGYACHTDMDFLRGTTNW